MLHVAREEREDLKEVEGRLSTGLLKTAFWAGIKKGGTLHELRTSGGSPRNFELDESKTRIPRSAYENEKYVNEN